VELLRIDKRVTHRPAPLQGSTATALQHGTQLHRQQDCLQCAPLRTLADVLGTMFVQPRLVHTLDMRDAAHVGVPSGRCLVHTHDRQRVWTLVTPWRTIAHSHPARYTN
jgi:hypothetical protein